MSVILGKIELAGLTFLLYSGLFLPSPAHAYVDPGTTGLLTQLLYVLFYGLVGVFFYCLRYIKQIVANGKQYFVNIFKGKAEHHDKA
jgi:hypothetical protein